jgi:hypothetical protein
MCRGSVDFSLPARRPAQSEPLTPSGRGGEAAGADWGVGTVAGWSGVNGHGAVGPAWEGLHPTSLWMEVLVLAHPPVLPHGLFSFPARLPIMAAGRAQLSVPWRIECCICKLGGVEYCLGTFPPSYATLPLLQPGRTGLTPHWEPAADASQLRARVPKAEELGVLSRVGDGRLGMTPRLLEPESMLASNSSFRPVQVLARFNLRLRPLPSPPSPPQPPAPF